MRILAAKSEQSIPTICEGVGVSKDGFGFRVSSFDEMF